jgi:hypothetical protein
MKTEETNIKIRLFVVLLVLVISLFIPPIHDKHFYRLFVGGLVLLFCGLFVFASVLYGTIKPYMRIAGAILFVALISLSIKLLSSC